MQDVLNKYKIQKGVFIELDNIESPLFTVVYNCENHSLKIMPHGNTTIEEIHKSINILFEQFMKGFNEENKIL